MAKPTEKKVALRLLVDKEKKRVVFAEADGDFVDILLSFLTLPVGTIIRLLGKPSGLGCMNNLYQSVKDLDAEYWQTNACKTMLLQPKAASGILCEDLKVNINDPNPRGIYLCRSWECFNEKSRFHSSTADARCCCGKTMDKPFQWVKQQAEAGGNGVFIKGEGRSFIISDGLHVSPASTAASLALLHKLRIKDGTVLQETLVDCGRDEVLNLLKRSLLSTMALSEVFLWRVPDTNGVKKCKLIDCLKTKAIADAENKLKRINLKILLDRESKKVLYAEAGADLVNQLLSFLTVPLGSIAKLSRNYSSLNCIDNLYQSAERLSADDKGHFKSKECKTAVLDPKIAAHFGCTNQHLRIDEMPPMNAWHCSCVTCYGKAYTECIRRAATVSTYAINPKLPDPSTKNGGGFVKFSRMFIVTDDLVVTPASPIAGIKLVNKLKVPIASLEEREVSLGESEALDLLKASLVSRNALSRVFSPWKQRSRGRRHWF